MGKRGPKKRLRQAKVVKVYLTPERLDKIGWNKPQQAIYWLIDHAVRKGSKDGRVGDTGTTTREAEEKGSGDAS